MSVAVPTPPAPKGFKGKIIHIVEYAGLFPPIPIDEFHAFRTPETYLIDPNSNPPVNPDGLMKDPLLSLACNPERQCIEDENGPAFVPPTGLNPQGSLFNYADIFDQSGALTRQYVTARTREFTKVYNIEGEGDLFPFGNPLFDETETKKVGYDQGLCVYTHRGINGIRVRGQKIFPDIEPPFNTKFPRGTVDQSPTFDALSADDFECYWNLNFELGRKKKGSIRIDGNFEASINIESLLAITGGTGHFIGARGQAICRPRKVGEDPDPNYPAALSINDPSSLKYDVFFYLLTDKKKKKCHKKKCHKKKCHKKGCKKCDDEKKEEDE